jgi:Fe-Mn family superoxide dismutase
LFFGRSRRRGKSARGKGGEATGVVGDGIKKHFGSFEAFKKQMSAAAAQVEGSGWAILGWNVDTKQLVVVQSEIHQDIGYQSTIPLFVIDVWEHEYYLRYQNKRPDYVAAIWSIVNWDAVNKRAAAAGVTA